MVSPRRSLGKMREKERPIETQTQRQGRKLLRLIFIFCFKIELIKHYVLAYEDFRRC